MAGSVDIQNLTRRPAPRIAFTRVAESALPGWEISLVFVGPTRARELNLQLRQKTYTPNVLSYALGDKHGEIFICLHEAAKQAPAHEMSERQFVLYLFIHALMHLKGMAHGATMERCERKILAQFSASHPSLHGATHSDRH